MGAALLTIRLLGLNTGRIYCVSGYASDASSVAVKFDETKVAVAGSPDNYQVKENCKLIDVCLTSDLATPTHLQLLRNGQGTGDILDCTAHLASVVARPNPNLPLALGDKLGISQIA